MGEAGGELRTEVATESGDAAGPEEAMGESIVPSSPVGTGKLGAGVLGWSSLPSLSIMTMTPWAELARARPADAEQGRKGERSAIGDDGQGKGEAVTQDSTGSGAEEAMGKPVTGEPREAPEARGGVAAPGAPSRVEDVTWLAGTAESVVGPAPAIGNAIAVGERGSTEYPALRIIPCATSGFQWRSVPSTRQWACEYTSC